VTRSRRKTYKSRLEKFFNNATSGQHTPSQTATTKGGTQSFKKDTDEELEIGKNVL
jgi:hypothetical protein